MSRRRTLLSVAAFGLLAAPIATALISDVAIERDTAWLETVRQAEERCSYRGRRVVTTKPDEGRTVLDIDATSGGRPRVSLVARRLPDGREVPYTRETSGHGASGRWLGFLRGAVEASTGRGRRGRFSDPALVLRNYRLVRRGDATVAGRRVEEAVLLPRHPGRASYRLSVDGATRFPLAFTATSPDGAVLYDSRFEEVAFDPAPAPPSRRTPRAHAHHDSLSRTPVEESELPGLTPFIAWTPGRLPAGFRRVSLEIWRIRHFGESLLGVYSDGMTQIFISQVSVADPAWRVVRGYLGLGELQTGAPGETVVNRIRHPGGTVLDLSLGGTEIFIGGQLDPAELERVAAGMKRVVRP